MASTPRRTTKERVQRTLQQLGYTDVSVADQGDGKITLRCVGPEHDEHCIVRAAIKNVIGVTSVTTEVK